MRNERGLVLVWALFLHLLVGAASSVLFLRSGTLAKDALTDRMRAKAFWAAEGGLARCRHALAKDPEFTGETATLGKVTVVSRVESTEEGFSVTVTANPGAAKITADLRRSEGLPEIRRWRR